MKLSKIKWPDVLAWVLPMALIVPNVVLDITESTSWPVKAANLLLPLGVYMLLAGWSRRIGRTVVLALPLTFFVAFQVVLLYLYGESVIAVDMYLNLVTTNVSEATELLGNLGAAIITIIVLYLLPLGWGIVAWCRGKQSSGPCCRSLLRWGAILAITGFLTLIACLIWVPRFRVVRDIFPANVINNLVLATERTSQSVHYRETSADFAFHTTASRDSAMREVYVLVVGETSRADNWQILGYERPTNPLLSHRDRLVVYGRALSESNITHKSVPLALSCVTSENFADSIYRVKSLVSAFSAAGYRTLWLSNQQRNHSFIDFFANEADTTLYLADDGRNHFDHELLHPLRHALADTGAHKTLVVLHTYGSHFNYRDRYPASARPFTPESRTQASRENRAQLINAYDNTIAYTDGLLDSIINIVDKCGCPGAVMYFSDHGEDIFDDSRERFLHASPTPTYHQLHVPVALWISPQMDTVAPMLYVTAAAHRDEDVSSSRTVFDTMLHLAGLHTEQSDSTKAVTCRRYARPHRRYLNDYNESVPLEHSGLHNVDFAELTHRHISYN